MAKLNAIVLILSDARGIYIPRDFVCNDDNEVDIEHCEAWGIKLEDAAILQNPDNEGYWDAWNEVLNYAEFTDSEGNKFELYQEGDLWGICYDKVTTEEKENFGFDVETDEENETEF